MEGRGEGYWFLLWSYPNFVADCRCTGVCTFLLKVHTSPLPFNISLLCLHSLFFLFVDLWHLIPASRPCWLSSLLVLSCTPSTPVFSSPQKPTFSNSNSTRNQVDLEPLCRCATCKSLFIYLFIFILLSWQGSGRLGGQGVGCCGMLRSQLWNWNYS